MAFKIQVRFLSLPIAKSNLIDSHFPVNVPPRNITEIKGNRVQRSLDILQCKFYGDKMRYINNRFESLMQSYPTYKFIIPEYWNIPENNLLFSQYITKTHLISSLPKPYSDHKLGENMHNIFVANIVHAFKHKIYQSNAHRIKDLQRIMLNICMSNTINQNLLLKEAMIDQNVKLDYSWCRGGYIRPVSHIRAYWSDECALAYNYSTTLDCNIRLPYPLTPIVPLDSESVRGDVEMFNYNPVYFGLNTEKVSWCPKPGFLKDHDTAYYRTMHRLGRRKGDPIRADIEANRKANQHLTNKVLFPYISFRTSEPFNTAPGLPIYSSIESSCANNESYIPAKPMNEYERIMGGEQSNTQEVKPLNQFKGIYLDTNNDNEDGDGKTTLYHTPRALARIHANNMLHNFTWLNAATYYLGFTPFNELTYPLTTQSIVTDGRLWNFYVYQLNTNHLWMKDRPDFDPRQESYKRKIADQNNEASWNDKLLEEHQNELWASQFVRLYGPQNDTSFNERRNLCWHHGELKLFDYITDDDQVIGYNPEILNMCFSFFMQKPNATQNICYDPYLDPTPETIENYEYKY